MLSFGLSACNLARLDTTNSDNHAPVTTDISATLNEFTPEAHTSVDITLNPTDEDNDAVTYSLPTMPSHGILSGKIPNLTYTPVTYFNGTDTFTYYVSDGVAHSNTSTITITVVNVNQTPVAESQTVSAVEDTPTSITFVATDIDPDPQTFSIVSGPSHGTLSAVSGDSVTYTPNADYNGTDSFTFKSNDGTIDSNTATVSINISAVNDAPVSYAVADTTNEDTPVGLTLSASDVEGDPLTYSIVAGPSHGSLGVLVGNAITYTPAANYNGTDTFTYRTNDGALNSNTATVTITITPVNDAPVASAVIDATNEDTPKVITLSASDIDGDTLTYSVVAGPAHGSLGVISGNTVTYTPDLNYNGADSFTFKVNDGTVDSNVETVSLTINAVNDAPVADAVADSTNEDTPKAITLSANDVDGDSLTYSIVAGPAHGSLGAVVGDGVTYTPNADYNGTDTFTFRANDGTANSNTATVTITVDPVNDAPVAYAVVDATNEDTAKAITLSALDVDGDTLTYIIVAGPSHGTLGAVSGDSVTYTPDLNYNGPDSFTYKANDGTVNSNIETVSITVNAVNDAPVADAVADTTDEDTPKAITLSASDVEGDSLTYSIVAGPSHGSLGVVVGDSVTYTPSANYNGADSFTYRANDGTANSNTATVTLTVNPVNDAPNTPSALGCSTSPAAGSTLNSCTLTAATPEDVDGDSVTYVDGGSTCADVVVDNGSGNATFTAPAKGGTCLVKVKSDDGALFSGVVASDTITGANNAPTLTSISNLAGAKEWLSFTISYATLAGAADEADADGDTLSFRVESVSSGTLTKGGIAVVVGTTTIGAGESLVWTPDVNTNGTLDAFTVKAHDGTAASATAIQVKVEVLAKQRFCDQGDHSWASAGNWFNDDACTDPTGHVPGAGDYVVIKTGSYFNDTVAAVSLSGFSGAAYCVGNDGRSTQNIAIAANGVLNLTCDVVPSTFSCWGGSTAASVSASFDASGCGGNATNFGTVGGNASFVDSENVGTVSGNATFSGAADNNGIVSGIGTFNGTSTNGASGTVGGDATFNDSSSNFGTVNGATTCNTTGTCP